MSDPAATTAWSYTRQGRLATKSQTVGAVTHTVSYGYNAAGQLASLTTPSGQLRAARTIADLDGAARIGERHLAQALQHRSPSP